MVWSLIILILNSVVLYVVPEGRVAYWADWRFWGLTKSQWGDQHITVGFLFLIAGILHIYYNWNPILAYMKNKAKELKVFTMPSSIGLALTAVFVVGTYLNIPPMSTILDFGGSFKEAAAHKYGEPPYGHAELSSLKMFSKKENMDLQKAIELLDAAGIKVVGPQAVIKDIAIEYNRTPQQVYEIIKPAAKVKPLANGVAGAVTFPEAPKPGWGKMKLSAVCSQYNLKLDSIIQSLASRNITAQPENSIKEIAAANDLEPMGIFEALYEIVIAK